MTDFLTRLAQRQLGEIPTIQPRLPALYAPVADETTLRTTNETRNVPAFRAEPEPAVGIERSGSQAPGKELTLPPTVFDSPCIRAAATGPSRASPGEDSNSCVPLKPSLQDKPRLLTGKGFEEADIPELSPLDSTGRHSAGPASSRDRPEFTANEPHSATAQLVAPPSKTAPAPPPRLVNKERQATRRRRSERTSLPGQVPPRLSANPDRLPRQRQRRRGAAGAGEHRPD